MRTIAHGTSVKVASRILKTGLRPRNNNPSLWEAHPSMKDCVYLTSAYAQYFARHAARDEDSCAIIEVDLDQLNPKKLLPDEDAIAQGLLHAGVKGWGDDLVEITRNVREDIGVFREFEMDYNWSLNRIGNCSHRGLIPVKAIKRIVVLHDISNWNYIHFSDPTITPMNFRILGDSYQAKQAFLLGYEVSEDELLGQLGRLEDDHYRKYFAELYLWIGQRTKIVYDGELRRKT